MLGPDNVGGVFVSSMPCLLQDITDGEEFEDWVMRLVDVGSEKLAPGWTTPVANSTTIS